MAWRKATSDAVLEVDQSLMMPAKIRPLGQRRDGLGEGGEGRIRRWWAVRRVRIAGVAAQGFAGPQKPARGQQGRDPWDQAGRR
jgi:hypothetical protein